MVDGCDRKHYCKGYCMAHYERLRLNGSPGPASVQERGRTGCAASGCPKPHYSLGYCQTHYERFKVKGTVEDSAFQSYGQTGCKAEGCEAPHFRRGYCMKHDYRMRAWGTTDDPPPRPVECSAEGCGRRCFAKGKFAGLCKKHAERMRLYGFTDDPRPSLRERFLAKAIQNDGCWGWDGSLTDEGYGRIMVSGRPRGAHVVAYELFVGPIPEGAEVDHVCHSRDLGCPGGPACPHRRCSNPDHLEAVTPDENKRRAVVNQRALKAKLPVSMQHFGSF